MILTWILSYGKISNKKKLEVKSLQQFEQFVLLSFLPRTLVTEVNTGWLKKEFLKRKKVGEYVRRRCPIYSWLFRLTLTMTISYPKSNKYFYKSAQNFLSHCKNSTLVKLT